MDSCSSREATVPLCKKTHPDRSPADFDRIKQKPLAFGCLKKPPFIVDMPLSSPDGYLDFTNAVPRAVKMVATSNVGIGTSSPQYALDVHGTSNTGPLTVSSLTIADGAIVGDVSISGNLALTSNVTTSVDSNVVVEHKGPHGRLPKAVPLRKYPEIVFESGKFDSNPTTRTYVQAGYTVTASSSLSDSGTGPGYQPWGAFNGTTTIYEDAWISQTVYSATAPGVATTSAVEFPASSGRRGEYIDLQMPNAIKVSYFVIKTRSPTGAFIPEDSPGAGYLYGSNDGTTWIEIKAFSGLTYGGTGTDGGTQEKVEVNSTTAYKYLRLQGTHRSGVYGSDQYMSIGQLEYYGYEEDPPVGDTSIDTTFTSVMNTPQTTGANVYVDGNLGETFTNRVTGPTPTGTATTYNETGKYWELTGALTSNVTVEANTFLEGDQPHAVSVWFNSSNLEANTANTCIFSISDQEKLDSVNLDLQSNTWHNLTYAYQGEGGSRVTYLDGRKVSEDQAEDTFGDYPPFAMTGYSQGGYVVSASTEYGVGAASDYLAWEAFDDITGSGTNYWSGSQAKYDNSGDYGFLTGNAVDPYLTTVSGIVYNGDWIQLEMPHKLVLDYVTWFPRLTNRFPRQGVFAGSNDGVHWDAIHIFSGLSTSTETNVPIITNSENNRTAYKYIRVVITHLNGGSYAAADNIKLYGHRENDLVRLPDPTRVLKYPHIKITNTTDADGLTYAIRGYEFSRSYDGEPMARWYDEDTSNYATFGPGNYNGSASGASGATTGTYNGSTNLGGTVGGVSGQIPNGEWHKIKMPHKILLSKLNIVPRIGQSISAPYEWRLYGSNDDSDWTLLYNKNDTSTIPDNVSGADYSITTSTAFKYFAIVMIKSVNYAYLNVGEFNWYGTGVDSIPIQIGGGNIDRVANFRVYDKFVEEDQALEIWDAQKDEFGRAKSSVTLHKGRLGIGTTEPEGRLAVVDEPHNLEEFPPRAMTGYKTYFEGHGEFCVSSTYMEDPFNTTGSAGGLGKLFDKGMPPGTEDTHFYRGVNNVFDVNGYYTGSDSINGIMGDWVRIDFPYRAKIQSMNILTRSDEYNGRAPRDGYLLGKNSDEDEWTIIHEWTGALYYRFIERKFTIEASNYYSSYALVSTRLLSAAETGTYSTSTSRLNIGEWRLFGTREQGQSVLHDGQLTLTKNLDVPRIGPALDADNTPRRDRLVVEYNTSTNPTFDGAVRDTSGRGFDGVFYGDARYDATEKAITLSDGTDDYVESGKTIIARGTPQHTFSFWLKPSIGDHDDTATHYLVVWGSETAQNKWSAVALSNDGQLAHIYHSSAKRTITKLIPSFGIWYHVVVIVKSTSATTAANRDIEIYVDGELYTGTYDVFGSNNASAAYYLDWGSGTSTSVRLGSLHNFAEDSSSSLSNIKLYDCALTAQEVKTLYDMGRCDDGHHVVNFSKTRVGIGLGDGEAPHDELDVRGNVRGSDNVIIGPYGGQWWRLYTFQHNGNLGFLGEDGTEHGYLVDSGTVANIDFTGQHRTFIKDVPFSQASDLEGLIVSSDQNKYIKLSGGIEAGSNAITINESLPVVSLSTTTNDKKCFGVISASEDPEKRSDAYGSFVTPFKKEKGDTRVYINSVGEGAIWVVNTNGSLESGDYITTSNVAGYGQKQDSEFLANYTVAKITMDCDFEPATQPIQIIKKDEESENVLDEHGQIQWEDHPTETEKVYKIRYLDDSGAQTDEANAVHIAAFVGCTYHCG